MRRRPAAAKPALRRPAADVERAVETAREKWEAGKEVASKEFSPGLVGTGDWIRSRKASYFEQPCEFAGRIQRISLEGSQVEAVVTLTGTSSEDLLKYATGLDPPVIRAHLCGEDCDEKRANRDLVHLVTFSQVPPADQRTWEENLRVTDENEELRRKQ